MTHFTRSSTIRWRPRRRDTSGAHREQGCGIFQLEVEKLIDSAGSPGLRGDSRRTGGAASGAKPAAWRFGGSALELARWLHVGIAQHNRTRNGSQPEVEVARSWNAMRQAAGRRPGEQPEREQRRDSDESEKSEIVRTQQEIEDWRGTEEREADAESAAAASFEVSIGEDVAGSLPPKLLALSVQPAQPAPEERILALPGLSFSWEAPGACGRAVGGVLYSMGGGGDCDWVDLSAGTLSVRTRRFTSRGGGRRRRFGRRLGVRGFRRVTGAARGGRLVELGAQFAVR